MSQKFALIIGMSEYKDASISKLNAPVQDVDDFVKVLQSPDIGGFDKVDPCINYTYTQVQDAIADFFAEKKHDDLLLMYFSGHGILDEQGRLYLAVKDTRRKRLSISAISAVFIMDEMDRCLSKRQVLILDCCYSGAFARTKGEAKAITQNTFKGNGFGRVVLTATNATQNALDGDKIIGQAENSVFTHYLIQGLQTGAADQDNDGLITLDELYDYVQEQVVNTTPNQTPNKWSYKQQGNLIIAKASAWVPYEIPWPDGSTMVVLPLHPTSRLMGRLRSLHDYDVRPFTTTVVCLGKYPITNAQYKRFVEEGRGKEPVGEHYMSQPKETTQHSASEQKSVGPWQGPFYPWRTEEFRDPEKPVVCVSYHEAIRYCAWVNDLNKQAKAYTFLPDAGLWDFAAFGTPYPSYDPNIFFPQNKGIHHKASAPAAIDRAGARVNAFGISDLLGNVWEWCESEDIGMMARLGPADPQMQVRGGGFLDDLWKVRPALSSNILDHEGDTRHSDLGFRIATLIPIENLPEEVRRRLHLSRFNRL